MRPTTVLMDEHRVIERVLDCLQAMVERAAVEGALDGEAAEQALDFFRHFADHCHHAKEEDLLFPLLEERGMPRDGGPTGVMISEHEQGRALVRAMADDIPAASQGEDGALIRFADRARAYVSLLRLHIQKEDDCLFPMADERLTEQDQLDLEAQFNEVACKKIGNDMHEKYLGIADALSERFGVATNTATP